MTRLPAYPYGKAILTDGDLAVVEYGHLCGYCAFPDDELPESWRGDYNAPGLQFLAIHGGITYAESTNGYSVFGFDCAHAGDEDRDELKDPQYILELARQMRAQIAAFRERQDDWLAADRKGKAAIIDAIREHAAMPCDIGFGGMIEMLFGAPSLGEGQ